MSSNIDQAIALLEGVAKKRLPDRNGVKHSIEQAIAACAPDGNASRAPLIRCVRTLGLIYARATGRMPGYSNSDNTTHFERFLLQLNLPHHLLATLTHIRAVTKSLDAKHDLEFLAVLAATHPPMDGSGNLPG